MSLGHHTWTEWNREDRRPLTRLVINDDHSYILYHTISDPNMAALEFSKVVGFTQEGFIDFIFGRVMRQSDYRLTIAVGYVLDKVAERSHQTSDQR